MNRMYARLYVLTVAAAALPLLDIDVIDYIKSLEFRQFLASSILTPLLTQLSTAAITALAQRMFGVI
jgi:hypothetical protein